MLDLDLGEVLSTREQEICRAIEGGARGERIWLEVLGSGLRLDARGEAGTLGELLAARLLRIRSREGSMIPLAANAAQREFERRRGSENIVLKARQMGISTWIAGRYLLRTLLMPGSLSLLVAPTEGSAEELFRVVHRFYEALPSCLRGGPWRTRFANKRQLAFPKLDSEFRIASAMDENAGRGLTVQNLHCSEVARWKGDGAETLAGLRAAVVPGGEIVLESTPNGAQGVFYEEWLHGTPEMVRHFLPWWREPAYLGFPVEEACWTDAERELVDKHGLTASQLGYRRSQWQALGSMAAQEFAESAESCFLASGACVFDTAVLLQRLEEVPAPQERLERDALWIWWKRKPGRRYVIALDPAGGGVNGDYASLQVIDMQSGVQCAEWQAHATVKESAEMAIKVEKMYPGALVVIELNNHGSGVLAHLDKAGLDLYGRGDQQGWYTSPANRPEMVERLNAALYERPEAFQSQRLLQECRTFVRTASGTPRAAGGAHDDLVMAMALALSVRAEVLGQGGSN